MISRLTTPTELRNEFHKVVYGDEVDYAITCAFYDGIYCNMLEKPKQEDIDLIREGLIYLNSDIVDSVMYAIKRDSDGEPFSDIPAISFMLSWYFAVSSCYAHYIDSVDEMCEVYAHAFTFRAYIYALNIFFREFFYEDFPIEMLTISLLGEETE